MNDTTASDIMTIEEVATYLHLHPLTVRALARKGQLPIFKVGRQWRIKRAALNEWIERQSAENVRQSDG